MSQHKSLAAFDEPEHSNADLELFEIVIGLLKELRMTYWVDQGSLLGLIRDGKFMSWDHDIDIGIVGITATQRDAIDQRLTQARVRVTNLPYVFKFRYTSTDGVKSTPVNIRIYEEVDSYCYATFWSVLKKTKFIAIVDKLLIKAINAFYRLSIFFDRRIGFGWRTVRNVSRSCLKSMVNVREVIKTRRVIFRVRSEYVSTLSSATFYGINLTIPARAEEYLKQKYGKDWRVPVKDWVWWKEDGMLFRVDFFYPQRLSKKTHVVTTPPQRLDTNTSLP